MTSCSRMWSAMLQPTIRRENASCTAARLQPPLPGPQVAEVRDPQHVRRSWAELALHEIVGDANAPHTDGCAPRLRTTSPEMQAAAISRSTRLRPTLIPWAIRSSAWIRGAPYTPRLTAWISRIFSVRNASVSSRSLGARVAHS